MGSEAAVEALRRSSSEPEAFVRFYDRHAERLLAYCTRRVYDADLCGACGRQVLKHPMARASGHC